jgi:hypothetical protein
MPVALRFKREVQSKHKRLRYLIVRLRVTSSRCRAANKGAKLPSRSADIRADKAR